MEKGGNKYKLIDLTQSGSYTSVCICVYTNRGAEARTKVCESVSTCAGAPRPYKTMCLHVQGNPDHSESLDVYLYKYMSTQTSGGSRISHTAEGTPTPKIIFDQLFLKNCMKINEIVPGGTCPWCLLRSANAEPYKLCVSVSTSAGGALAAVLENRQAIISQFSETSLISEKHLVLYPFRLHSQRVHMCNLRSLSFHHYLVTILQEMRGFLV